MKAKRFGEGKHISEIILLLAAFLLFSYAVLASERFPVGPQFITEIQNERYNVTFYNTTRVYAEAGNLTELRIQGLTQTEAWQGYYGYITGTIVLDDEQQNTMYNWTVAEPQGKIFASNETISDWSTAHCLDLYAMNTSAAGYTYSWDAGARSTTTTKWLNVSHIEAAFGIEYDDDDGVNETFRYQRHERFWVGTLEFPANTCNTTFTYINDTIQQVDFMEALLTVNNSDSLVFMTIIETSEPGNQSEQYGFDSRLHDFQMMVLDDGHDGNDQVTPYYFYIEIE